MSEFDYFMLLERKPILTQVEQDIQEAIQYPVCIEAPMILSVATIRRNHALNVCAGDYSKPSTAPSALPIAPPPVHWGERSPNVRIVRATDGVVEYHIDLNMWKHNP